MKYPKAVLVNPPDDVGGGSGVRIDSTKIIAPHELALSGYHPGSVEGGLSQFAVRVGGDFDGKGWFLPSTSDRIIVLDNCDNHVLLRLKKGTLS